MLNCALLWTVIPILGQISFTGIVLGLFLSHVKTVPFGELLHYRVFLSVECANFVSGNGGEAEGTDALDVGILPSNLWGIQSEIGTWNDYPSACSRGVVCAIVGLGKVKEGDLKRWIITSSPRFGVPIDVAMRDHVIVLFSLCLKAIVREGLDLLKGRDLDVKHSSMTMLACPILVRAMMWLASQLSVLYGEMHGKFFALDLLKKSTVHAASHLSLCPSSRKEIVDSNVENGSDRSLFARCEVKEPVEKNECELDTVPSQSIHGNMVFVSQVAAAVAALHERALLEEKIRALKQLQVPPRYQRLVEHTDISTRANEERQKRLDYRPIIDHDGLPRQPLSIEETSQPKTKEQLLAEERDYKRRRISYRGKKSKRNHSEVVKDIIEEYMEEIKQAGGIGCFEKIDGGTLPPGSLSTVDKEGRRSHAKEGANSSRSQFYFVANTRSDADNDIAQHDEQPRSYPRYSDGPPKGSRGGMLVEDYDSRSPERRKHGRSYERNNYHGERNHSQVNRVKHREFERSSSGRSDYHRPESYSSRNDMQDDERKSKSRYRRHRNIDERSSGFLVEDAFEDRYDPSRSHD